MPGIIHSGEVAGDPGVGLRVIFALLLVLVGRPGCCLCRFILGALEGDASRLAIGGANLAVTVKLPAGFDHQFGDFDFSADPAGADDFETFRVDAAVEATTDDHFLGHDLAVKFAVDANRNIAGGSQLARQGAVQMKVVV